MSPSFTLDVTRELSAQTLRTADEYGYDCTDTVHVIDGRADSADTVHIIDSGLTREVNEDGDHEPVAVAVRVPWRSLDQGATATVSGVTPAARKAARKSKVTGRGAARAVVVHVRWMYLSEGSDTAVSIIRPSADGLYPIGGWEWTWGLASWWCVCGEGMDWHDTECDACGMNRDRNPKTPLGVATWAAGATLRRLAPEATSALVDLHGDFARIISVFAGDTEIDTCDDTGPFDCETLGEADEILRAALDEEGPGAPDAAGWQLVPDEKTDRLYRIAFPASRHLPIPHQVKREPLPPFPEQRTF
ncbi:hypothetical protein [Streptomyces murinus]|uniref:hypothetical protein n=1 Tax=Streptomyces murinus TaxID=33900 RepID=UPI001F2A330B|nr:hypothetical protein [Streptomyces murinus]